MSTRNPMNKRYQGEGPGGQTRKSASSAKPATQAASTVHIKNKPTTASEKRAAAKAREREAEARVKEKAAKQAERAKAQELEEKKPTAISTEPNEVQGSSAAPKSKGVFSFLNKPTDDAKRSQRVLLNTEEYRKWRRVYWILLGIGLAALIGTMVVWDSFEYSLPAFIVLITIAYAAVIASFIINIRKMRPLNPRNKAGANTKLSPKALKHEQEARAQAAQVEAARKAAKAKKKNKQGQEKVSASGEDNQ